MASSQDVAQFFESYASVELQGKLEESTVKSLGDLMDRYSSKDDLAKVLVDKVPPDKLEEVSVEDFSKAVEELIAPPAEKVELVEDVEDVPVELPDGGLTEEWLEYTATELAEDLKPEVEKLAKFIVTNLWAEVRAEMEAELAASDIEWDNLEEVRTAAETPVYEALIAAVAGIYDAGESAGGVAALLLKQD